MRSMYCCELIIHYTIMTLINSDVKHHQNIQGQSLTRFSEQHRHTPRREQDAADEAHLHKQHFSSFANFKNFGDHVLFWYTAALLQLRGRLWLCHFVRVEAKPHRWPGPQEIRLGMRSSSCPARGSRVQCGSGARRGVHVCEIPSQVRPRARSDAVLLKELCPVARKC